MFCGIFGFVVKYVHQLYLATCEILETRILFGTNGKITLQGSKAFHHHTL